MVKIDSTLSLHPLWRGLTKFSHFPRHGHADTRAADLPILMSLAALAEVAIQGNAQLQERHKQGSHELERTQTMDVETICADAGYRLEAKEPAIKFEAPHVYPVLPSLASLRHEASNLNADESRLLQNLLGSQDNSHADDAELDILVKATNDACNSSHGLIDVVQDLSVTQLPMTWVDQVVDVATTGRIKEGLPFESGAPIAWRTQANNQRRSKKVSTSAVA